MAEVSRLYLLSARQELVLGSATICRMALTGLPAITMLVWALLSGCSSSPVDQPQPTSTVQEAQAPPPELPVPPQQDAPWSPPQTALPDKLIQLARRFYALGLADPRGCEYRNVTVGITPRERRAWVLPDQVGGQRYAVGYDGLVHPVLVVGEPADLQADIAQALTRSSGSGWRDHQVIHALTTVHLLRLGEAELAVAAWDKYMSRGRGLSVEDVYLELVQDFAFAPYSRGLEAYLAGDDWLALRSTERQMVLLSHLLPDMLAGESLPDIQTLRDLGLISGANAILFDEAKRRTDLLTLGGAQLGSSTPPQADFATLSPSELVELLDQARDDSDDPIVSALRAKGDEAVPLLIDCLETDTRLTRSAMGIRSLRPMSQARPVTHVAFDLLVEVLELPWRNIDVSVRPPTKDTIAAIRDYYASVKGIPPHDRWYRELADDTAAKSDWLHAARLIVTKTDGGAMRGELLRGHQNPSVTALLETRLNDLSHFSPLFFCALAESLRAWDPARAATILEEQRAQLQVRGIKVDCLESLKPRPNCMTCPNP